MSLMGLALACAGSVLARQKLLQLLQRSLPALHSLPTLSHTDPTGMTTSHTNNKTPEQFVIFQGIISGNIKD